MLINFRLEGPPATLEELFLRCWSMTEEGVNDVIGEESHSESEEMREDEPESL